jgi:hypothetical protein
MSRSLLQIVNKANQSHFGVFQQTPFLTRSCSSDGKSDKTPFYKKLFRRGKRVEEEENDKIVEIASKAQDQMIREIEADERESIIGKNRLKSRLFHSDRNVLFGRKPQAGLQFEKNDEQQSKEFKAMMFARFGKSTGTLKEVKMVILKTKKKNVKKSGFAVSFGNPSKSISDL